jgi:hypothetical protein
MEPVAATKQSPVGDHATWQKWYTYKEIFKRNFENEFKRTFCETLGPIWSNLLRNFKTKKGPT